MLELKKDETAMNNKVIYTCLVGNYDRLVQPKIIYNDFDYICFSNDISEEYVGVWKIKPIPYNHLNKTRLSRYVKLNPHKVLGEYDYSIWIDANIVIIDETLQKRVYELIEEGSIWAQIHHTFLNCIYEDIIRCVKMAKDNMDSLRLQYSFLKNEGYPSNNGLYENGLIFRRHNDKQVIQITEAWWDQYMKISQRDQQSLCYIYWKLDFTPDLLLPKGMDTRNHSGFILQSHTVSCMGKINFKFKNYKNRIILFFFQSRLFRD